MADKLFYLTVQDVLWINRQAVRRDTLFQYARLEEATFYQYAYGDSHELIPQAARFMKGLRKMAPFSEGNEATALVATLVFLRINGMVVTLRPDEAADWFLKMGEPTEALAAIARPDSHAHHEIKPDIREHIRNVMAQHAPAVERLTEKGSLEIANR
ncbi:hypothetical protein BH11ARM2_BH11ARM2_09350 [soil metagenome]